MQVGGGVRWRRRMIGEGFDIAGTSSSPPSGGGGVLLITVVVVVVGMMLHECTKYHRQSMNNATTKKLGTNGSLPLYCI